jgi:hypothetical protein
MMDRKVLTAGPAAGRQCVLEVLRAGNPVDLGQDTARREVRGTTRDGTRSPGSFTRSNGQPLAPFRPTGIDHSAAASRFHAHKEAVRSSATDFGGLVGTFHRDVLGAGVARFPGAGAGRRHKESLSGTTPCGSARLACRQAPAALRGARRFRKACDYSKNWVLPSNFDEPRPQRRHTAARSGPNLWITCPLGRDVATICTLLKRVLHRNGRRPMAAGLRTPRDRVA